MEHPPPLFVSTSIPYVNGSPHLGHAYEFVQADLIARHARHRGRPVFLSSGTDDHALKNVSAAVAAGVPPADFVALGGDRFARLAGRLGVSLDGFLRTSSDPRHVRAVQTLWRAAEAAGDLYRAAYTGRYCDGCEQFYEEADLADGRCPEHGTEPRTVTEENHFFRLSRHAPAIADLIREGRIDVEPIVRRNEVLAFLDGPVRDLSVSRPARRAAGFGIQVPGDSGQVVYVWFDALANYISVLGWASPADDAYRRFWASEGSRVHLIGKGIARFHAVYWIAFLRSAGLPLPTRVLVHDYLTTNGAKIAKSGARAADPDDLLDRYSVDALRWWLLREPARVGETDFTEQRLVAAWNRDLANGIGNLVSRVAVLRGRLAEDAPDAGDGDGLRSLARALPGLVDEAIDAYRIPDAARAITDLGEAADRLFAEHAPWRLVRAAADGDAEAAARAQAVVGAAGEAASAIATELAPFVPDGAARVRAVLDGTLPGPAFPRLAPAR